MVQLIKKIFSLVEAEQKKKLPFVFITMVLGALLETVSVSMLVPLVSIVINENSTENKSGSYLFIVIALLFIIKNIFLYFQIYIQSKFASEVRCYTQNKMYSDCMNKSYEYYLTANTGDILRNIYVDSMGIYNALIAFLSMLMEVIISVALIITLIFINPMIAGTCFIIILFITCIVYLMIKPKMQATGKAYSGYSGIINQWILQSTDNIKEIKVMRRETFFESNFKKMSEEYNGASCRNQVMTNVPKLVIEAGTITSIIGIMFIGYRNGGSYADLIPQLSAFALAAVRLLPSVNRINTHMNSILFYEESVKHVVEMLEYQSILTITESTKTVIGTLSDLKEGLYIRNVSYHYPDAERNVFESISLDIRAGETIGLIGESGAGKTTFVNLVLGLLTSTEGDILWDGIKINDPQKKYNLNIGYIPQQISLLDDSIMANIVFGSEKIDEKRVMETVKEAQLDKFISSLPRGIQTEVGDKGVRLSGGQRQRIGIARALYSDPDFLVLDEATSALDNKTEKELMEAIQTFKGKKTMIIIAHRLSTLENCDRIYKMEDGRLILQ